MWLDSDMTSTETTYMIFDPAGRPSIPTNNRFRVEHMVRQGWTATESRFGETFPVVVEG